jgi:Rha family phage regulatory protein
MAIHCFNYTSTKREKRLIMCILVTMEQVNGVDKVAATTSLKIAEFTGKAHSDVLFSIDELILAGEFSPANFCKGEYKNRGKSYPMYILDETFTTVLLMGFTGKQAIQWKLAYTKAFQEMRSELSKPKIVQRLKGDDSSELNRLMLDIGVSKRTELEGKTDHKGYCINMAKTVNLLCFGVHEPNVRQHMTQSFQVRLNSILADVSRLALRGITNPKIVYETLSPKYTLQLNGGSKK